MKDRFGKFAFQLAFFIRSQVPFSKGFKINDTMKEIKILQHADDCTIPANDSDSIEHIKNTVNEF